MKTPPDRARLVGEVTRAWDKAICDHDWLRAHAEDGQITLAAMAVDIVVGYYEAQADLILNRWP